MKLFFRVISLFGFILVSGLAMGADAKIEVKQMLDFFAEEWTAGDMDSIRSRFHRDFILVSADGIRTREQRLDDLGFIMTPGKDHGELRFSDVQIEPIGNEHALAYGRSRLVFKDGTELGSMFSSVYVNTPFGWKLILTHE